MKTRLFILLFFVMVSPFLFGQNASDESIKKVVMEETTAYFNHDTEAWQAAWVHNADASHTYITNGAYNTQKGWENFGPKVMTWLKANPKQVVEINNDSFLIKTDGNMAWVDYRQSIKSSNPDMLNGSTRECRVLLKDNGEWKIFSAITEEPESFNPTPQNIENSLNTAGYNLINAKKLNDAIEVFRLNVKLFPNSWNPYDSLGEALALSGDKKGAIENYEKSVSLNPKNDNGIAALQKLKAK